MSGVGRPARCAIGLPEDIHRVFPPRGEFREADLDDRQELHGLLADYIWSPDRFDEVLTQDTPLRPLSAWAATPASVVQCIALRATALRAALDPPAPRAGKSGQATDLRLGAGAASTARADQDHKTDISTLSGEPPTERHMVELLHGSG